MNDKFLNTLGLCLKAGRLSIGHDASKISIKTGKAELCILTSDASPRLKKEFLNMEFKNTVETEYTMNDIKSSVNTASAVLTVNDAGFAKIFDGILRGGVNI